MDKNWVSLGDLGVSLSDVSIFLRPIFTAVFLGPSTGFFFLIFRRENEEQWTHGFYIKKKLGNAITGLALELRKLKFSFGQVKSKFLLLNFACHL